MDTLQNTSRNFASARFVSVWSGIEIVTACILDLLSGLLTIQVASDEAAAEVDSLTLDREYVLIGDQEFDVAPDEAGEYKLSAEQLTAAQSIGTPAIEAVETTYGADWSEDGRFRAQVKAACRVLEDGRVELLEDTWSDENASKVQHLELDAQYVLVGEDRFFLNTDKVGDLWLIPGDAAAFFLSYQQHRAAA